MINLTLAIPGLQHLIEANGLASSKSGVPHLQLMAGRGKRMPSPGSFYDFIARCAGLQNATQLPLAMASALSEGLPVSEGYWLRADPVRLQASTRGVYCLGSAVLDLSRAEAEALLASLNIFLANDAIKFYLGELNTDWYMQVSEPKDLRLVPLQSIIGKDLRDYLPTGMDAALLEGLLSEIQMLLYPHEVNSARREQGLPTIDGLWVYGYGSELPSWPWQLTVSDDNALRGLAVLAQQKAQTVPSDFQQILSGDAQSILLTYSGLQQAMQCADWPAYQQALQVLESQWLLPAWQALCRKKIKQLTLQVPGFSYQLKLSDVYRFWRRPLHLADILC